MNPLDWISPTRRRARLRRVWRRGYEAAAKGNRTSNWSTLGTSGNAEVGAQAALMRDRARDLVRNNGWAAKAKADFQGNVIDTGLRPRPATGDDGLDLVLRETWETWIEECHDEGCLDFYGLQAQLVGALWESGEVFVIRKRRDPADGLAVPLQLQVLEADFLNTSITRATDTGGRIVQGIETAADGRRIAYHFYKQHPGETVLGFALHRETVRVEASEVIHLFDAVSARPGQLRGVPWPTPGIRQARDYDDGRDAERVRRKLEACFTATVEGGDEDFDDFDDDDELDNAQGIAPRVVDSKGVAVEKFRPGLIMYAPSGKSVKMHVPGNVGGFSDYASVELHGLAAAWRTSYEELSTDLRGVNFSSIRKGDLNKRRLTRSVQWHVVVHALCRKVWAWFVDAGVVEGLWPLPPRPYKAKWIPAYVEEVDRKKNAEADELELRLGGMSWGEYVESRGKDPRKHAAEIGKWIKVFDEEGIPLTFFDLPSEPPPLELGEEDREIVPTNGSANGARLLTPPHPSR